MKMKQNRIKPDHYLKEFWKDNERFADLFNTVFFQNAMEVDPSKLKEMDTDLSSLISFNGYLETLGKTRDVIKKSDGINDYVVFAVESQMEIHYGMPLRAMLYDALTYLKEVEMLQKKNRKEKGLRKAEFLSGLKKEDRIHPVITLVIYYGEKEWDGPKCLEDMMVPMSKDMKNIFSDYKMNLLQVTKSDDYEFRNQQNQDLFELSRKFFRGEFDLIERSYKRRVSQEAGIAIGLITGYEELVDYSLERKEGIVMCEAVQKWKERERKLSREAGR